MKWQRDEMMWWWDWLCGKKRDEQPELSAEVWRDLVRSIPILQVGVPAVLSVYFDLFSSFMQAFIFCMLTTLYIANAADDS